MGGGAGEENVMGQAAALQPLGPAFTERGVGRAVSGQQRDGDQRRPPGRKKARVGVGGVFRHGKGRAQARDGGKGRAGAPGAVAHIGLGGPPGRRTALVTPPVVENAGNVDKGLRAVTGQHPQDKIIILRTLPPGLEAVQGAQGVRAVDPQMVDAVAGQQQVGIEAGLEERMDVLALPVRFHNLILIGKDDARLRMGVGGGGHGGQRVR